MKPRGSRANSCKARASSSANRASRPFCSMSENGGASTFVAVATKSLVVAEAMSEGEPLRWEAPNHVRRPRLVEPSRPSAISYLPQIEFNLHGLPERHRLAAFHCGPEAQLVRGLNRLLIESVGQAARNSHLLDRAIGADQHTGDHDALNLVLARLFGVARLRRVQRHGALINRRGYGVTVAAAERRVAAAHVVAISRSSACAIAAADAAACACAD